MWIEERKGHSGRKERHEEGRGWEEERKEKLADYGKKKEEGMKNFKKTAEEKRNERNKHRDSVKCHKQRGPPCATGATGALANTVVAQAQWTVLILRQCAYVKMT